MYGRYFRFTFVPGAALPDPPRVSNSGLDSGTRQAIGVRGLNKAQSVGEGSGRAEHREGKGLIANSDRIRTG